MEMTSEPWQSFKITRSIRQTDACEYDFQLLKDHKTSILGDICCSIDRVKYTLDRSILASKSRRFERLMLSESEEKIIADKISEHVRSNYCNFDLIVGIIYGKGVRSLMNEDNFVRLLINMLQMDMEIDLEIFKTFMEQIIPPKPELNGPMFMCLTFLSKYFISDYLLSTVSGYFSKQLLDIYKMEKFLKLSVDEFVCILSHKSDNVMEKHSIGRICAEWICYDYQRRIKSVKVLVNASRYRYEILPYCDWNSNLKTELLQISNSPDVQRVEIYFNELLFSYLGEVSFEPPAELNRILSKMKSGDRILFPNDQICKWTSYLEKEILCDVAIKVHETTFRLHRIKLSSVSGYFNDLFTNSKESLEFEIVNSDGKSKISKHELNQIDATTFKSIVDYIYKQEIEVTSLTHLINLLKGSKFLKINDLFEKCFSKLLEIARTPSGNILEIFQYVCEYEKFSEVYNVMVEKIIALWPKLDENSEFENISLDVLKEIVALPNLKIVNTDEIVDLCAKWIFYDIQNRYKYTIEVAKAINRNFMMNSEQIKLEIPLNSTDFSQLYVKEQLIRILTSSALVPLNSNNILDEERRPAFLLLNKDNDLWVVDGKFNEIVQLAKITEASCRFSATSNEEELFILYRIGEKFYFQLYQISTKRMILLATDARMNRQKDFVILICRDEVYFCNDEILLKYSVEFNRWIPFEVQYEGDNMRVLYKQYTSDGEKLYTIGEFSLENDDNIEWLIEAFYYDFEKNKWISMPEIDSEEIIIEVGIIKRELSVLFESEMYSFNWITQTWGKIFTPREKFVAFKDCHQNIMYFTNNEVHLYSPATKEWTKGRNLDGIRNAAVIHKIFK